MKVILLFFAFAQSWVQARNRDCEATSLRGRFGTAKDEEPKPPVHILGLLAYCLQ